jgi:hypothetical protein
MALIVAVCVAVVEEILNSELISRMTSERDDACAMLLWHLEILEVEDPEAELLKLDLLCRR